MDVRIAPADASSLAAHAPQGQHLLLTLSGCPAQTLDNPVQLTDIVQRAAGATGATVLNVQTHHFQPHGVTVLVLLAESHLSLHTYPQSGVAFVDCFTCGACDPTRCVAVFSETLHPQAIQQRVIHRSG